MSAVAPLTWLYAPADRPELLEKAVATSADVVIADLEDAVASDRKAYARDALVAFLAERPRTPVHVRINDSRSPHAAADVAALLDCPGVSGVRIPKVEGPAEVVRVARRLASPGLPLHPLLESSRGIEHAHAIAAADPAVAGIALGEADLSAELGTVQDAGLDPLRSRVVVAAHAAGLPAPAQSVYTRLGDAEGLAASCRHGRALGFFGRAAIHPRQLDAIVEAYLPDRDEVERALELASAAARAARDGSGALVLADGRFVDAALVKGAERTIAVARRYGLIAGAGVSDDRRRER